MNPVFIFTWSFYIILTIQPIAVTTSGYGVHTSQFKSDRVGLWGSGGNLS